MIRRAFLSIFGLGAASAVAGESQINEPVAGVTQLVGKPVIRVWKLGSLEHRIFPTEAAVKRLADMLAKAVEGKSLDIIWGPELDVMWMPMSDGVNLVCDAGIKIEKIDDKTMKVTIDEQRQTPVS